MNTSPRIINPKFAEWVFTHNPLVLTYIVCSVVIVLTIVIVQSCLKIIRKNILIFVAIEYIMPLAIQQREILLSMRDLPMLKTLLAIERVNWQKHV